MQLRDPLSMVLIVLCLIGLGLPVFGWFGPISPIQFGYSVLVATGLGFFVRRWVSGAKGEPLTGLPEDGVYQLRHAACIENDPETGEITHYEFIVLVGGQWRFLVLPFWEVYPSYSSEAGDPGQLVYRIGGCQDLGASVEYVLQTSTGHSDSTDT